MRHLRLIPAIAGVLAAAWPAVAAPPSDDVGILATSARQAETEGRLCEAARLYRKLADAQGLAPEKADELAVAAVRTAQGCLALCDCRVPAQAGDHKAALAGAQELCGRRAKWGTSVRLRVEGWCRALEKARRCDDVEQPSPPPPPPPPPAGTSSCNEGWCCPIVPRKGWLATGAALVLGGGGVGAGFHAYAYGEARDSGRDVRGLLVPANVGYWTALAGAAVLGVGVACQDGAAPARTAAHARN